MHPFGYHVQFLCTNCGSSISGTSAFVRLLKWKSTFWQTPKKRGLATMRAHCVYSEAPAHQTTAAPRFRTWGQGNSKRGPLGNPHSSPNGHRVRSGRRRLWLLPRGNVTVERHWIKGTSGLALSRNFLLSVSLHV